ncbi:MAG TPA: cysteine desulfurase NifS, partial [Selenomonas sp.]|nr:cysteine desulfurase NifS [Selenomonas sp.]
MSGQEKQVYLDYAATTPVDERVLQAMLPYFRTQFGNPSSLYSYGRAARQAVAKARRQVAALLHATPEEIFFTSG